MLTEPHNPTPFWKPRTIRCGATLHCSDNTASTVHCSASAPTPYCNAKAAPTPVCMTDNPNFNVHKPPLSAMHAFRGCHTIMGVLHTQSLVHTQGRQGRLCSWGFRWGRLPHLWEQCPGQNNPRGVVSAPFGGRWHGGPAPSCL